MLSSEELLASPLVRKVLTPDEIQQAEADEDWLVNDGMAEAKTVFTLSWDSSMPGSCRATWITEWRGVHFFDSSDLDPMGPFASLEEALDVEYLERLFDYFSIDCDVIPLEDLVQLVEERFEGEIGATITINNTAYELTEAGLVLQEDEVGGQA